MVNCDVTPMTGRVWLWQATISFLRLLIIIQHSDTDCTNSVSRGRVWYYMLDVELLMLYHGASLWDVTDIVVWRGLRLRPTPNTELRVAVRKSIRLSAADGLRGATLSSLAWTEEDDTYTWCNTETLIGYESHTTQTNVRRRWSYLLLSYHSSFINFSLIYSCLKVLTVCREWTI